MIRMKANLIDLDKIEVELSKNYYSGNSAYFYLRDIDADTFFRLNYVRFEEGDKFNHYFFENVLIDLSHNYQIVDAYGMAEILQYTKLALLDNFDALFSYDGYDLGSTYFPSHTIFKVWAPTALRVMVSINVGSRKMTFHMTRKANGVFYADVQGDFDNYSYQYYVKHHNSYRVAIDPYAFASTANHTRSIIVDMNKVYDGGLNKHCLKPFKRKTDAIIYEASVRDFTMSNTITCHYPGKYLGMVEEGLRTTSGEKAGLDYLVDLGITHIQLMPIQDFATVDENHPEVMYNWGYDPAQYGVPEGSYATDPNDGYTRIRECREMVRKFHEKGIRVILDVVYNHVHDVNAHAFERIVPMYYFRKYKDGTLSNGSWCGNDINSTARMVRNYIVEMCIRWIKLYGVDGYRFDLMGILDIDTIKKVYRECRKYDDDIMIYGEGWNMDTALEESKRAIQENHSKLVPISFFNNEYRDTLKGASDDRGLGDAGYIAGNMSKIQQSIDRIENSYRYTRIDQSINYFECHDNATIYDKFFVSNSYESVETRKRRQLLLNMVLLVSQGIPFIHSGQEFYRTKGGRTNTYNTLDFINSLNWDLKDQNLDSVELIKQMIQIRKENECFKFETEEEAKKHIWFEIIDNEMIKYNLTQDHGTYEKLVVYINASDHTHEMEDDGYEILLQTDKEYPKQVGPISMVILGKKRG